jgi:hypothetical protein
VVAWIRDDRGVRTKLRAGGSLIGRDSTSDIVIHSEHVPARHAVLLAGAQGTEIVVIAGPPLSINGRVAGRKERLSHGDVLSIAGRDLVHEWEADPPLSNWLLELDDRKFGVVRSPFSIGGSESDDLVVASWPSGAVRLYVAGADLLLEPTTLVTVAGRATDEHVSMRDRDTIVLGDVRLRARRAGGEATTIGESAQPGRVVLEMLPNGGLLTLEHWGSHAVWLADRRCDLVAALLQPPGARAGDFVPDAKLLKLVWPNDAATRSELNTLIYRVRQALARAGLDGASLVERAASGGATRFAVGPSTLVDVTS